MLSASEEEPGIEKQVKKENLSAENQGVIKGTGKTVVEGEDGEGKCIDEYLQRRESTI